MMARDLILPSGGELSIDEAGRIAGKDADGTSVGRLQLDLLMVENRVAIGQWLAAEVARRNRDLAQQLLSGFDPWTALARLVGKPSPPALSLGGRREPPPVVGMPLDAAPGKADHDYLDRLASHQLAYADWLGELTAHREFRLSELQARSSAIQEIRRALMQTQLPGPTQRAEMFCHALGNAGWPTTVNVLIEVDPGSTAATVQWHTEVDAVLHVLSEDGMGFEPRPLEADSALALRQRYHLAVTVAIGLILFAADGLIDELSITGAEKSGEFSPPLTSGAVLRRAEAVTALAQQQAVLTHTPLATGPAWFSCTIS